MTLMLSVSVEAVVAGVCCPAPSGSAAVLGTHNQKVNFDNISKSDVDNLIILKPSY